MPRVPIDYANTIIYKIVCNDLSITDSYVGHTTDFVRRKQCHKDRCLNEKGKHHNLKIYKAIRENEGWTNWSMLTIEKYPCKDVSEASIRERYYYELLHSNLNSNVPQRNVDDEKYSVINKDKIKEYYIANREHIDSIHKIWYENNRDKISKQKKLYQALNKEQLKERRNKLFVCECGREISHSHKGDHLKTKIHNDLMLCKNVTPVSG
jgi:hypothetical protein